MLERERREGVRREKTDEERDSRRLEEKSGREMRTESTGEGGYRREKRDRREQRKKDREERRQGREQDREERRRSRGAGEELERLLADGRGPGWDQKFMKRHRTKQAAQTRIIVADQTSVRDSLGVDRMLSLLRRESSEHRFLGVGPWQRWTRNQRHRTK
jgi:hypothetical protein